MINSGKKSAAIVILYFLIGIILIVSVPTKLENYLYYDYIACVFSYFFIFGLLIFVSSIQIVDIFDPIILFTVIYSMLFIVEPIIDIRSDDILWFGIDLMQYGVKSTIIADVGYLAYVVGYVHYNWGSTADYNLNGEPDESERNSSVAVYATIGWCICFALTVFYLLSTGKSLVYILTGGMIGEVTTGNETAGLLGFISMFSYCLPGFWVLYEVHGNSKLISILLYVLSLISYWLRGFRYIIIIVACLPIFAGYIKKGKRPTLRVIILLLLLLLAICGVVGYSRSGVRSGASIDYAEMNIIEESINALKDNFQIYKTFYGLVGAIPSKVSYYFGQQMIVYTIIMFVPRIIWSGKPARSPGIEAIKYAVSDYAITAGTAYPCIGEYYLEFGVIGVIVFMYIFGKYNRKTIQLLTREISDESVYMYTLLLLANFQLIIRGYTPSNFYLLIFFMLPFIGKRIFIKEV